MISSPPAHQEFYPLVILDVPIYGFLVVIYLPGNVRRSHSGTHVQLVAFQLLHTAVRGKHKQKKQQLTRKQRQKGQNVRAGKDPAAA